MRERSLKRRVSKKEEIKWRAEEKERYIYTREWSQDYKMASLIPVIVLNFAGFLLCPVALFPSSTPPFLSLLPLYSEPHTRSPAAILTYCYGSSLLTESKRISSPSSKELSRDDSWILLRDDSNEYSRRDASVIYDGPAASSY